MNLIKCSRSTEIFCT